MVPRRIRFRSLARLKRTNGAGMAISDDGKRGQIGPSLRGLIYQYERDGYWVTSKWPKKRGKVATPKQKLAQQAFKDVMLAMKLTAPPIQIFHRLAAVGTPMLPRDSLMAALYGNGPTIPYYSGRKVKPMANLLLSSTVLDAIGWEPGDLLMRGVDHWEALKKPSMDAVLFYDQGMNRPVWVDGDSLGGNGGYWMPNRTGQNSSLSQSRGAMFQMLSSRVLAEVFFIHNMAAGAQMRIGIYRVTAAGIITHILHDVAIPDVGNGATQYVHYVLPAAIAVEEDEWYCVMLRKVSGTGGANSVIGTGGLSIPQVPINFDYFTAVFSGSNPGIGDSVAPTTSYRASVGLRIK